MNEELIALAERCEQAAGPDRELDVYIALVTGELQHSEFYEPEQLYGAGCHAYSGPAYTASLDAAMTLIDDELVTVVMREALDRLDECFNPLDNYLTKLRLFACAAALRARAQAKP